MLLFVAAVISICLNMLTLLRTLSDTTKSGQLFFPEFALAMHLCQIKLREPRAPLQVEQGWKNAVSAWVDKISFAVPDDRPAAAPTSNVPNFNAPSTVQQPQAQSASNTQLLSQMAPQPTGFQQGGVQPQPTGFQQGGFQSQPTLLQPQQTGFQGVQPQATGYNGPRPPIPPMPTGYAYGMSPQQTGYPAAPLNAQPTGYPGQLTLVDAPASGLPSLMAMTQGMMPQANRTSVPPTQGLRGNAHVPWAVTRDEKTIYDDMFRAWDGLQKGYIAGEQARGMLKQSGLGDNVLERIWTLSDPHNKGRLDMDEFAVAMHLVYLAINGHAMPDKLPDELIPPSHRNLNDSIGRMKSMLSQEAQHRKSSGAFLQPQKTGVSYLKNHSFRETGPATGGGRKDATVFKNNDDDVGYRSSARRRLGEDGRSPSPAQSPASSERSADEMTTDQLKKAVREKQVLLDAMDFQDENNADQEDALDRKDRRESEELFRRIRQIQEKIDTDPKLGSIKRPSDAERRNLRRQLQGMTDRLPELASQVRRCERAIADAQLELFRLKDAKAYPNTAAAIVGTGPGGAVTESDRLKARARAMMQQRSAALTGKPAPVSGDDGAGAAKRMEEESSRVRREKEENERMVQDVEESVTEYSKSLESGLKEGAEDSTTEHERRRWEDGLGVEDQVKDFIFDLQRSSRSAKIHREDATRDRVASSRAGDSGRSDSGSRRESPAPAETPRAASSGASYSSYKTGEDRAAFIKQQAEARMAERLAALGLRAPSKPGETAQQKQERERKEKEDRLRKAEEEDARREQERQQRLADEQIVPPSASKSAGKKPPPAPAPRKGRADSIQKEEEQAQAEPPRVNQHLTEQALKDQQQAQASETRGLE